MSMSPAYVETAAFNCVETRTIGCDGRKLTYRTYLHAGNPDQRPGNDISHTVIKHWTEAGSPDDYLIHIGPFARITVQ